jgi:microcystin-dependent protein
MAVPVPLDIQMGAAPAQFSAQSPDLFKELAKLVAEKLTGTMDISLLLGQNRGNAPTTDIGPWLKDGAWLFWDAGVGGYTKSQQGCPIGTVAMWGSKNHTVPNDWLLCNGQSVSATQYSRLFQAIGYTWGGAGALFKLPPSGRFYLNSGGSAFVPDPAVPLDAGSPTTGLNIRGGSQVSAPLQPKNLPPLKITTSYTTPGISDGAGVVVTDFLGSSISHFDYTVLGSQNLPLGGTTPQPFSIMPPFVSVNFMIKFE